MVKIASRTRKRLCFTDRHARPLPSKCVFILHWRIILAIVIFSKHIHNNNFFPDLPRSVIKTVIPSFGNCYFSRAYKRTKQYCFTYVKKNFDKSQNLLQQRRYNKEQQQGTMVNIASQKRYRPIRVLTVVKIYFSNEAVSYQPQLSYPIT